MFVNLDYHDSRPIYEQIADGFKKLILSGVMQTDEQMPSVRSLSMELSANPNTVQKAYSLLEKEGFIYTVRGRGNFVKGGKSLVEEKKQNIIEEIRKMLKEAESIGVSREEILSEL